MVKVTEQFLSGATFKTWLRLLAENRFRVDRRYIPRALYVTFALMFCSPFALYEKLRFGRRIAETAIEKPPVFILGHWRSGTTYLHVLMAQDPNLAHASNLQVVLPRVFLGSGRFFERFVRSYLPEKRWMDNLIMKPDLPSEEEFALANLVPYSLYHSIVFPQNRTHYAAYCTMDGVAEEVVEEWKQAYLLLLKKLTYAAGGRRLVLKNPANTSRVKLLLEMFPEAKFIHIYRNPYEVFASTSRMYEKMFPSFYLQDPDGEPKEFILVLYKMMYERYFQERHLIPEGNLVEVRYEDFVREPLPEMQRIYQRLDLPGFEEARAAFHAHIAAQRDYEANVHVLNPPLKEEIAARWRFTLEHWGYLPSTG